MSNASERSHGGDVLEALYASRRARAEAPRLASVNEQAPTRAPRPDAVRPMPLSERLQTSFPDPAQGGIDAEAAAEPEDFNSEGVRRKVFAGVIGVAAAVAVASVVALLLVNIFPKDKDADQSVAATVAPPPAQARQSGGTAKAAPSQVSAPAAASDSGQKNLNHEQSERLLQQFMQWRQKAAPIDKP
jgi:hypothetical protein